MFEKEAEEYADKDFGMYEPTDHERYAKETDWKNGAEFGFQKGIKVRINTTTISDCPIKDEWHYPSKGELPKCDEKTQLIFYVNCYYEFGGETKIIKRTVLGFYKKSFMNDDVKLFVEKSKGYEEEHLSKDVIAWKEIVLPE